jgi:hypothetical protein
LHIHQVKQSNKGNDMKLRYIATMLATGAAAAAIAAAPGASAANAITSTNPGGTATTTQSPGSVSIQVAPPHVSKARSYGEFSSPAPFFGN